MCWFGTHPKYAKLANILLYVTYQVFTGSTENPHTSILSSKVRQCQHQQLQTDNSMGTLQWANRQQQSSLVMVLARSSHGGSLSTPWCIKNHDKDGKKCERQWSTNGDNGEALATPWHSSANGHCRGSIWQKGKTAECQVGLAPYCHTAQQAVTAPLQMTGAKLWDHVS